MKSSNPIYQEISITKRSVAREQLDHSIGLVLGQTCPVAAHTLAWAAVEVLRGVANENGVDTVHDVFEDWIKPEFLTDWRKLLKRAYNFSKHADHDPNAIIDDFKPELTTWTVNFH